MSERVVDFLEPVQVHPENRHRVVIRFPPVEHFAQPHLHRHAVFHAGQAVEPCQPFEFGGQLGLLIFALQRFQNDAVRGLGNVGHGEDHQEAENPQHRIAQPPDQDQTKRCRQQREAGLPDRDMDTPRVTAGNATGIGRDHTDNQHMQRRIVRQ